MLAKTEPPKTRVLIIDDSRLVRVAVAKMFGNDFEIVLAVDGAKGWEIIQRDPDIEVVFTDLVMPEMDGFELLEVIRTSKNESISSLPVIVATGADNPEMAKQKAFSLGATDFITKPFDATQMKARARSYAHYRKTNNQLKEQTTIDLLTGLLNNRGMERQMEKEMSFVARHHASITLMSIEVDFFKDLFIRIGRAGAEAIIRKVADVLIDAVRCEDTVSRNGVASFLVAMPMTQGQNALELAERICQTVEGFKARLDGERIPITVSVGVCSVESDDDNDVQTVIDAADEALARATALGRSQLHQLTILEYKKHLAELQRHTLSIDDLLDKVANSQQSDVMPYLDIALERLAPLLILLSNEQKQRVITYR